jgi:hypothetical protein
LPDDQEDNSSWDTWYLNQDITYESIHAFHATADADEEDVILHEKGTVESEYDDEFNDEEVWEKYLSRQMYIYSLLLLFSNKCE